MELVIMKLINGRQETWNGKPARRKAATYMGQHKQKKRRQISMPRVGLEPTTPVLEREKTVHALDGAPNLRPVPRDNKIRLYDWI
jgi:hypothetical protein